MRFLGKQINSNGQLHQMFSRGVVSDFKRRPEEVRVKHSINGNSVKLYEKAYTSKGCVLRAEATIHNADDFRVYRRKEGDPKGPRAWRRLRRGICRLISPSPALPQKLQHAIWTLSLPSTTPLPSTNCSTDWNNHGNGAAVGCVPSAP